jgi:UDP-2-acetamido-2,6-beta-L-arabino-hexul-4-ose reductase
LLERKQHQMNEPLNTPKQTLVTGSRGFIGSNLIRRLKERGHNVITFDKEDPLSQLRHSVESVDAIVHLAGANRPVNESEFQETNVILTKKLVELASTRPKPPPIAYASSTHACLNTPYGTSKRLAEELLTQYSSLRDAPVGIFRLPNVFGKWSRPNYNSVVATFCHNLISNIPITIHDPEKEITLAYIDDVVESFIQFTVNPPTTLSMYDVSPTYTLTVSQLHEILTELYRSLNSCFVEDVGTGLRRCLYATLLSHLSPSHFTFPLKLHRDPRGDFVEFIKTASAGQCSVFTCNPGHSRGGHYHHTKSERFLVLSGEACFQMRNIRTNESTSFTIKASEPCVVTTTPGWAHTISNPGTQPLIVAVWANESFNPNQPDTFSTSQL